MNNSKNVDNVSFKIFIQISFETVKINDEKQT